MALATHADIQTNGLLYDANSNWTDAVRSSVAESSSIMNRTTEEVMRVLIDSLHTVVGTTKCSVYTRDKYSLHFVPLHPHYNTYPILLQEMERTEMLISIFSLMKPMIVHSDMLFNSIDDNNHTLLKGNVNCNSDTIILAIPLVVNSDTQVMTLVELDHVSNGSIIELSSIITLMVEHALSTLNTIAYDETIHFLATQISDLNKNIKESAQQKLIGELSETLLTSIHNPIQIILAHVKLMRSGVGDSTRRMEIIEAECNRVLSYAETVMQFGNTLHLTSNGQMDILQEVNILELLNNTCSVVKPMMTSKGITIHTNSLDKLTVKASINILSQSLLNLLISIGKCAIGTKGSITISAFQENKMAVIHLHCTEIANHTTKHGLGNDYDISSSSVLSNNKKITEITECAEYLKSNGINCSVTSSVLSGLSVKIFLPLITKKSK
jgi:hypothetical protein